MQLNNCLVTPAQSQALLRGRKVIRVTPANHKQVMDAMAKKFEAMVAAEERKAKEQGN